MDHIFDEFFKADESRHHFESSGLGMTICKRIVELHGGEIWVDSEGLNKGTTFSFKLKIGITDTLDSEITKVDSKNQRERIKKIFHQGREILYFDFSNFTDDDYESFSQEITRTIADHGQKDLLVMTNVSNNSFSIESVKKTRKIGKIIQPYLKKSAIIGITKHQEMFLKAVKILSGIEINIFQSVEEARDWLVEE